MDDRPLTLVEGATVKNKDGNSRKSDKVISSVSLRHFCIYLVPKQVLKVTEVENHLISVVRMLPEVPDVPDKCELRGCNRT